MRYKNKRTVLLYILVFLLVSLIGMLYSSYPFFKNFSEIFYGGLIVVWAMTVLRRIIESQFKELLIEIAILLLLLILFQALRFRFDQGYVTVHRFMWYCYYLPMLFIPVISFKLSLRCGRSEELPIRPIWNLLLIPSAVLSLLVLTNDRHHLVFRFPDPEGLGYDVYTHGPVYIAAIVWISVLLIATVVITIVRFSSKPVRKDSWAYYVVLSVSAYFLLTDYFDVAPVINGVQYLTPVETFTIFTLCGWEACIQTCLIPSNSGYKYFFENSGLIARITDKNGKVMIASKGPEFDFDHADENYHILEKDVWGGKLSYAEDISGITESNRELKEISERLLEENALQEAENKLQEDRVHVSVMNKLYDDITEFSSEKTKEIEKLLTTTQDDVAFKQNLEKACILASYIKRRGNLYILGEENRHYDFNDLYLSFKESLDYFALSGARTLLTCGSRAEIDKDAGLAAYDCLEEFLEKNDRDTKNLLVHMEASEAQLILNFMLDRKKDGDGTDKPSEESFSFRFENKAGREAVS